MPGIWRICADFAMSASATGCRPATRADTDVAACIDGSPGRTTSRSSWAYAEGVRDGAASSRALETAHAYRKPIVFMKVGGFRRGRRRRPIAYREPGGRRRGV